jgi:hypothetical protein
MSVLTTSQLTFCDLRDSYSVYVDAECVGVVCDKNGLVIQEKNIEIKYRAFAGSELVGASCIVSNLPSGVTFTGSTDSTNTKDGSFSLNIAKGATLDNSETASIQVTFTTSNAEKFTFVKYITLVKSMKGQDGTDAIDFQIYSVDGFKFNNYLTSIELKTAALRNGEQIGSGLSYQWYYCVPGDTVFNPSSTDRSYIAKITEEESGCQVYCIITDKNGNSVQTNTVTLKTQAPIYIIR